MLKVDKLERPVMITPTPEDTEYQRGVKDGMWNQIQITSILKEALTPTCSLHLFPEGRRDAKCIRCGEPKP